MSQNPQNPVWNFRGHTVLVSGGARGIGRAIVRQFALAGANVVFGDRDTIGARETMNLPDQPERPGQSPAGAIGFVESDFANPNAWKPLLEYAAAQGWEPTILVPNVGIGSEQTLETLTPEAFERVQRINVTSALSGVLHALPALKAAPIPGGNRSVILVSSVMSRMIFSGHAAYTISKAAINGMSRALAVELAPEGIRVNSVLPGFVGVNYQRQRIPPALWDEFERRFAHEFDDAFARLQPLPRGIKPAQIADAVLFLASDAARSITGVELVVDGGFSLQAVANPEAYAAIEQTTPEMEAWIKEHNQPSPL